MLFSHTLFSIPRKGSAVSPGRAFSLLTKNSTPKPNGVLFFLVLLLSVPLVAQGVDLVGKLGKILVGPALVVLDDAEQPLAGADQPLEHRCSAGRSLAGLVLIGKGASGVCFCCACTLSSKRPKKIPWICECSQTSPRPLDFL